MKAPEITSSHQPGPEKSPRRLQLSLFWRTFFLLALLILCSSLAWLQMFRTQEYEPRILRNAHQIATVVNLTKTLAWNLGPDIRVNAVAPGWMEGDWMQRMLGDKYDDLMGKRAKLTPLKRCVTADDVAETMLNLLTANRFVTGEIVVIDGGFTSST